MDIDTMEPSRDMDLLVATKVMGWKVDPKRCPVCGWKFSETAAQGCVPGDCSERPPPKVRYDEGYAHYSTDIAASRAVVKKIGSELFSAKYFFIEALKALNPLVEGVRVNFVWWLLFYMEPIDICRAALKGMEDRGK